MKTTTRIPRVPRLRIRESRVVAIRCATCRTWRKPRHFTRNGNTCRRCPAIPARMAWSRNAA
ncbi:hypothetical protein [Actinoplanes sp. NBRC 103695]|uniref:hypothetical protein n=1 Tax=Actinoplanes sp. NBRC 103695 TaxID=3032202 RepID=UPI0024A097B1|nr:hypothetical protein [Actinoplanes sp. NBRC 103695]GLY97646.1 hypothetical protein Acsp02_49000 [Actinoplanes sp. NBRC 103695]